MRRRTDSAVVWAVAIAFLATVTVASASEPGATLQRACSTCHGTDLVTQQRLTLAQWEGVVAKMQKWGAVVPPDEAEALAVALAEKYSTRTPADQPPHIEAARALAAVMPKPSANEVEGSVAKGRVLYKQLCLACHGIDARGQIGLALADKPILDQPGRFADVLAQGQRGMPPLPHLEARDRANLLAYLRTLGQGP